MSVLCALSSIFNVSTIEHDKDAFSGASLKGHLKRLVPYPDDKFFFRFFSASSTHGTEGVQDGDDGHAYVGEYGLPHVGNAQGGEEKEEEFDADCEDDVLADNAHGAACNCHRFSYFVRVVIHEDHIGGFYGGITSGGTH